MVIQEISKDQLQEIIAKTGFDYDLLVKDYYITQFLYALKDIKGIYFKGGTALAKTLLHHARLSEDIDFTIQRPLAQVRKEIEKTLSGLKITQDKDVEGFVRLVVHYSSALGKDTIFIDVNERGKLLTKPEVLPIEHFYPHIPKFSFPCLSREEMVAEKVAAAIGRNRPRDHYDIYQIIKKKIPMNMELVKKKCAHSGDDPSIIKMFNKAKRLHNRWQQDLEPLLVEEVTFQEVMQTLAQHFHLKEAKEEQKDTK